MRPTDGEGGQTKPRQKEAVACSWDPLSYQHGSLGAPVAPASFFPQPSGSAGQELVLHQREMLKGLVGLGSSRSHQAACMRPAGHF